MTFLYTYLLEWLIAGSISVALMIGLGPVAARAGLVARPGGRKTHERDVPLVGGLCIAFAFFLSILLFDISLREFRILFFASGVLLVTGILDDYKDISPAQKLFLQTVATTTLILIGELQINQIGDIFGTGAPINLGQLAPIFTIIAVLAVLNSFNMIDGHDGVAIVVSLFSLGTVGLLYYLDPGVADEGYVVIILLLIVTALPFLIFNFKEIVGERRQLFLGDAGVMFLGLMVCFFLIVFTQGDRGSLSPVFSPTLAPWIVGIPLMDMISVTFMRVIRKKKIFHGGREHLHHVLVDSGVPKHAVLCVVAFLHGLCCLVAIAGWVNNWSDKTIAISAIVAGSVYVFVRVRCDSR
jgi:UDP-GlcNAc:undecaprenyl-phosphate/decaprenyl-phosphate GlcNAc-1-phosphate transferase